MAATCGVVLLGLAGCSDSLVAPDMEYATLAADSRFSAAVEGSGPEAIDPQSGAVVVSNISAVSGRIYTAETGLAAGHPTYGDRSSVYDAVPSALQGQTYIRTRNNDNSASGINEFLSFQTDRSATVYVAYDGSTPPAWLRNGGFTNTGQTLVMLRDTDRARLTFTVWARNYPAGRIVLGSNRDATSNGASKYMVIVQAAASAPPPSGDFTAVINGIRPRGFGQGGYTLVQPTAGRVMYWVATTGNDANPGTSAQPFRTVNRAAQVARAGDVVTIRNGRYDESVSVLNAGTAGARIVFQAEQRGQVVLGGSNNKVFQPAGWIGETGRTGPGWVTVRGLIFRNYGVQNHMAGNAVRTGRGWRIEDCLFDRSAVTGINIMESDVEVLRSTFQLHEVHAFLVGTQDQGATSPSDPRYRPLTGIRFIDVVLRGNHTTTGSIDGAGATRVAKIMQTRGLLIDNMESSENHGQGMWLDTKNTNFTIRNSYFHRNRGHTTSAGGYRAETGRGLYLEKNWGGGVVENNVMMGNEAPGIQLVNTGDVTLRGNLFVRNDRCVLMTNMTGSSPTYNIYPFRNIRIERNSCKDWARASGYHWAGGPEATPALLNITVDHNTYEPVRNTTLAWWPAPIGGATTIQALQRQFGWEQNGRIAPIPF